MGDGRSLFSYLEAYRPRRIAFHLPAWLSPFVSLSKIAGAYLRCKPDGNLDLNAYKNFCNTYLAEPWFHMQQDRKEDTILALRDDRPSGIVPGGGITACLVATVDTQDKGFYYEIRAIGYGRAQESWGVRAGFVDTNAGLEEILFKHVYKDIEDNIYPVQMVLIDAMGHRTAEVYDLCRDHPSMYPLKGEQRISTPHSWSNIEFYPGTKKPIPGGMKLLRVNTSHFKDQLSSKLDVSPADPGAWHLGAEYTEDWAAQLCSEYIDPSGKWACQEGKANHAFDLGCYFFALVDVMGVKFWPRPEEQKSENQSQSRKEQERRSRW